MKGLEKSISLVLIVLFFLSVIFCLPQQISTRLKLEIIRILELPLKAFFFASNQIRNILFYPAILRENVSLREEIAVLTNENVQLREVLKENERLNALLSFKQKASFRLIAARIISRDIAKWSVSLTIDKGLNDGIYLEMPVIAAEGLIGWVKGVGSGTAQVMLITDMNSKIAALIQDTRLEGILEGTSGRLCRLKFLEVDAEVKKGQMVVTSGLSSTFPQGLIIGRIKKVIYKEGQLQKIAMVEPAVNFDRLEEVLCIDLSR